MKGPEQHEILGAFADMLAGPTGDGANKRARGEKPHWKVDTSHLGRGIAHLDRYLAGERVDVDSGCHPLIHAAWRFLAVAYQDMHNTLPRKQCEGQRSILEALEDINAH